MNKLESIGRLALLWCAVCAAAFAADWGRVEGLAPGQTVEVTTRDSGRVRGTLVRAGVDSVVLREAAGERSVSRGDVTRVRVHDPGRRIRRGVLWTAVGAAAGAGIGFAVCPGCANEGAGYKYVGPGVAVGAGLGALGFLTSSYRTVYKAD